MTYVNIDGTEGAVTGLSGSALITTAPLPAACTATDGTNSFTDTFELKGVAEADIGDTQVAAIEEAIAEELEVAESNVRVKKVRGKTRRARRRRLEAGDPYVQVKYRVIGLANATVVSSLRTKMRAACGDGRMKTKVKSKDSGTTFANLEIAFTVGTDDDPDCTATSCAGYLAPGAVSGTPATAPASAPATSSDDTGSSGSSRQGPTELGIAALAMLWVMAGFH